MEYCLTMSIEDRFLTRLARGQLITQEEFDQLRPDLADDLLAAAFAARFEATGDVKFLLEAARLYHHAGFVYETLEVCSRAQRHPELHRLIAALLPRVRSDYDNTRQVGKLVGDSLLVIDLIDGTVSRFPALL